MWSSGVIIALYVFEDRSIQFLQGVVISPVGFFLFQVLEKAFTYCVVERIAFFGKGLHHM